MNQARARTPLLRFWDRLGAAAFALMLAEAALVHFYIPYQELRLHWMIFAVSGVMLASTMAFWRLQENGPLIVFPSHPRQPYKWLALLISIGILLRVGWVLLVPPVQYSDALEYWNVATRLVNEGTYYSLLDNGQKVLAYRPPGLPLLLAGMIFLFGTQGWIPTVLNLLAYLASGFFLYGAARRIAGTGAALMAVALLTTYPASIVGTGIANAELVSLAYVLGAFWALLRIRDYPVQASLLAGFLGGYAVLVKPSLELMPVVSSLYLLSVTSSVRAALMRIGFVLVAAALVVSPWLLRNDLVLGELVMGTNGGDVFYRANNPMASGTFTPRGEKDLGPYKHDELLWNRMGYALGKEWIWQHPLDFAKLALKKQSYFFESTADTWTWFTVGRAGTTLTLAYWLVLYVALAWWVVFWILISVGLLRHARAITRSREIMLMLLLVLYLIAVHSVFESQPRYLVPICGFLMILASLALVDPSHLHSPGANRQHG